MKSLVFSSFEISHTDRDRKTQVRYPYLYFQNKEALTPGMARPRCPYGEAGDILMIKEVWRPSRQFTCPEAEFESGALSFVPRSSVHSPYEYLADVSPKYRSESGVWSSAESMPADAVRFFIKIEDVHLELLQDISTKDCVAEGISIPITRPGETGIAQTVFKTYWEEQYGEGSWALNPSVWVISYRKLQKSSVSWLNL